MKKYLKLALVLLAFGAQGLVAAPKKSANDSHKNSSSHRSHGHKGGIHKFKGIELYKRIKALEELLIEKKVISKDDLKKKRVVATDKAQAKISKHKEAIKSIKRESKNKKNDAVKLTSKK